MGILHDRGWKGFLRMWSRVVVVSMGAIGEVKRDKRMIFWDVGTREKVILGRATRAKSTCSNVPLGSIRKVRGGVSGWVSGFCKLMVRG